MRNTLLATACALALAGCSTGGQTSLADLTPDALIAEAQARPDGALAPQTDYALLFDALPGGALVSVGAYEPEGSGSVAEDVLVSFGDSGIALRVDELRAYDLDPAALESAEGAVLASRLDLRGVSFEGLGAVTSALTEGITEGMLEGALDGTEIDQDFGRYDYRMERFVLDGFTVAAMPEGGGEDDLAKQYLLVASLFGADRFLATGVTGEIEMRQTVRVSVQESETENPDGGVTIERTETAEGVDSDLVMTLRMDEFGGADWRGFDTGMQFVRGITTETQQTTNGTPVPSSDFRGEEIVIRDFRLSKLLPYLLSETMPPADETDLLSFGRWEMTNLTTLLGGQPFSTTEKGTLDLTQWHGLMPTRITYEATERLDVAGLVEMVRGQADVFAAAAAAEAGTDAEAPDLAMVETVATALREAGLETIRSQGRLDYAYAPDTGAMTFATRSDTEEMGAIAFELAMGLPAYAQLADTPIEAASPDLDTAMAGASGPSPLQALFAEETTLDRMALTLDDEGGLDALLQVVIAIANATEPSAENPGVAMLRDQTPEGLRQMLAGLVTMGSVQAAQAVPQASDYATALSAWLSQGGELRLVVDPESPLGAAALGELQTMPGGPAAMVDRLGISVTHTE